MKSSLKDLVYPLLLVVLISVPLLMEHLFGVSLSHYGLYPRDFEHLYGIITIPFLHSGWQHLFNNSTALFVLGWMLFHFYRSVAWKTILWIWLLSGLWLWIGGRANFHIGASAVIYGLAGFLFVGGILRKHLPLMGISLLVLFLYGSMVWGIFPIKEEVSWEGHLFGMIAGVAIAYLYRLEGPQRKKYSWELEDELDGDVVDSEIEVEIYQQDPAEEQSQKPQRTLPPQQPRITYIYRSKNPSDPKND